MRARPSIRALALAVALTAAQGACKTKADSAPDSEAPGAALAPGAMMTYASGGGATGKTTKLTVFTDGRVEVAEFLRTPVPPARVPLARVERLATDLAATGVFSQKDGSWAPSKPVADGGGAGLVVRDKTDVVHSYYWETGATAPESVVRAMEVGGAFAREVERQNPRPPCACRAGDPLCACF